MKVLKVYNQNRRDCVVDLECQSCGHKETITTGYDDANYWENVVPNFKCGKCDESTNDLNLPVENRETKYREGQQI